jgi:uncharacterized protein YjbI with pentapeptide repeats
MVGAYLRHADLREANLQHADLKHAYFDDADLTGADLRDADLRGACFKRASLRRAYLRGVRLRTRGLFLTTFDGADLTAARGADAVRDAPIFRYWRDVKAQTLTRCAARSRTGDGHLRRHPARKGAPRRGVGLAFGHRCHTLTMG